MTFDQLRTQVLDYCGLQSPEAQTRVGKAINRHYRRVTSTLGLDASRFITRTRTTTIGSQTATFTDIEKIDRVRDTTTSTSPRLLQEVSIHKLRSETPGTSEPSAYAVQNTGADSVTIRLDTVPQIVYTLQADGWTTLSDLSGTDEPVIPESFHDVLAWFVIAEELLKKEKLKEASAYEQKAEKLLAELRFHLADSHTRITRQGEASSSGFTSGGSGGGSGTPGDTSYTQSALLTFDRGAGLAPFAVAQATAALVTNLDADKLDGSHLADVLTAATAAASASIIPVDLASEVTGRLPYANMVSGVANQLVGRRSGSAGDLEAITLGTGLSMSTTTLNADPTIPAGASSEVQFRNGGSFGGDTTFTFNSTTDQLTVPLLDISAAAGGQIIFPATQNPSIGANTLDDYEEGTWTPTITGSGGQSGQAYSSQDGRYVKVGGLVWVSGFVALSTLGTVTGDVRIGGLPFTAATGSSIDTGTIEWQNTASSFVKMGVIVLQASTSILVYGLTAAATSSTSALAQANLGNTSSFIFSIVYRAAN
jgi:hypothetical protein